MRLFGTRACHDTTSTSTSTLIFGHYPKMRVIHTFEFMSMIFDNPGVDSTAGDKAAIYWRNKSYNRSTQDTR